MPEIMNRGDIVDEVAAQVDLPQSKVDDVLKAFESALKRQASSGGEVRMVGFGSFKITRRAARTSRNPQTGDPVEVSERNAIRFVPGKAFKDAAASSLKTDADTKTAPKKAAKAKATEAKAPDSDEVVKADAKKEKKPAKAKKK